MPIKHFELDQKIERKTERERESERERILTLQKETFKIKEN